VNTITERAERGAALLDETLPGWWQGIDLDRLDIESECDCIAGQVGGDYLAGTEKLLGLRTWEADVAHGFGADDEDKDEYHALTLAWRALILKRRELADVTA
jgi:hypothetical protein